MKQLKYKFKDENLLKLAMTQSGVDAVNNNERLEFIGDRVLGLSVALLLYDMFPLENEGELARRHSVLVSTQTLAQVAKEYGLDKKVRHGHMTGGRLQHIAANAMEALLGAIYLDAGFEVAKNFIVEIWQGLAAAEIIAPKDSKTRLQELVQKDGAGALPVYEFFKELGAAHSPTFNVNVSALGHTAVGVGVSKKAATIDAADNLLKMLAKDESDV